MGKKTTVQKNDPWAPAQPYILDNLATTKATFDQNQPGLQAAALEQQGTYGRLAPGAEAGVSGAQSLVNRNLSGANLNGNPYLEGIIGTTRRNVANDVNGMFNASGRFGSGANQGILAAKLAEAENGLRFNNYSQERGYQQNAIGDAQNLMGGATGLLNNAAQLPWVGVQAQNGGTNSLTNGYGVRTTTENSNFGSVAGGLAGTLGGAAITQYSDERVKNVTAMAGTDPRTGLRLYDYTYKGDPSQTPQTGVMAQDVEKVAPEAVGQDANGVKMVDYGALGMPDPAALASLKQNVPSLQPGGVKGFIGGLLRPGADGIGDTVSRIGESLLAGAGGGWGDIGKGLMMGRADARQRETDDRKYALDRDEAAARGEYFRARTDKADAPVPPRIIQRRDGSVISVDGNGVPTILSGAVAGLEPLVATENGYQPRSKAVGLNPYRAPARVGGGAGGVTPTARAKLIGDAEAAIAAGAPRAAVYARLAKMGVQ